MEAMYSSPVLRSICVAGGHVPVANLSNIKPVEVTLKALGIRADISVRFLGTGIGSDPNRYVSTETNRDLTHREVLELLRSA